MVVDAGFVPQCPFLNLDLAEVQSVLTAASGGHGAVSEDPLQKMPDGVFFGTTQYQLCGPEHYIDPDVATPVDQTRVGQRTQKPLETLARDKLLTTQQAWEVAKARGYTKSKDAFRAWSRRSPEKCQECHGLIVVFDPQQGKLIGYQEGQVMQSFDTGLGSTAVSSD